MALQETVLKPQSEEQENRLLESRIMGIKNLIKETVDSLPLPIQTMYMMYHGTVNHLLENLTFEQTEQLIEKVQSVLDSLKGCEMNDSE